MERSAGILDSVWENGPQTMPVQATWKNYQIRYGVLTRVPLLSHFSHGDFFFFFLMVLSGMTGGLDVETVHVLVSQH